MKRALCYSGGGSEAAAPAKMGVAMAKGGLMMALSATALRASGEGGGACQAYIMAKFAAVRHQPCAARVVPGDRIPAAGPGRCGYCCPTAIGQRGKWQAGPVGRPAAEFLLNYARVVTKSCVARECDGRAATRLFCDL